MPDWFVAEGVTPEDAHYLTALDNLRANDPVLWALTLGIHTSESIAKHIAWPHHWVLGTLRRMKQEGSVWDSEGRASVIWDLQRESEIRLWVLRQRRPGGIFRRSNRNDD